MTVVSPAAPAIGLAIGVVLWAACVAATMSVAKAKDRSQGRWGVAGALAGVFALIAVALAPSVQAKAKRKRRPTPEYYKWREEDPAENEAAGWLSKP